MIRRFWRFGQSREVIIDKVFSDGQQKVIEALELKAEKANELFSKLNKHLNKSLEIKNAVYDKEIKLPAFI